MESSLDSISIINAENNTINKENLDNMINIKGEEDFNFDKSLELSKIEVKDEINKQKNKNEEDNNIDDNNLSEYSFIKENDVTNNNKKIIKKGKSKTKITKEELNNIPLPIFSCIYCCDENVSFNHLSKEIISNKYLFQTSIYDMKTLDNLISGKRSLKIYDNKLYNIVINNFENLKDYFVMKKINKFFKSKKFGVKCECTESNINKKFRTKLEEKVNKKKKDFYFKEIKGMYKISKHSLNNKGLFNSNSIMNNYSTFAGLINAGPELIQNLAEKKNNSLNSSHVSNLNMPGDSKSWKKNEIGLIGKDNNNNRHYVENIVEKIDKNVESDIFDFLGENYLKRKINKKDIEWEDTYYDINKPIIDDDISELTTEKEKNVLSYNDKIKNRSNTSIKFDNPQNVNISNSKHISINSENKSTIKISLFNISKSLASTNTSSNIIQKNNKSLSIFLNKNTEENSIASPRYNNIIIKNIKKPKKEINLSPSFSKKRILTDLDTKTYKKIFSNGNSYIDLKNFHKKILFNHTVNINKELNNNQIGLELKQSKINKNENEKNLLLHSLNKIKNKNNKNIDNKDNLYNKSYRKYKLILNNKSKDETNNKIFLSRMIKRFKSTKNSNKKIQNLNPVFKLNKYIEKPYIKSPLNNNIKYSLVFPNNKEKKKLNVLNLSKKYLNINNLENEYINNFKSSNLSKKENNFLRKKYITENNNNNYNGNFKKHRIFNYPKKEVRIIS